MLTFIPSLLNKIITGVSYEGWFPVTPCFVSAYGGVVTGESFHITASQKKSRL